MKVLLRQDIDGIGRRGDIVDVADGYARNFLIPGGHGLPASKGIQGQAVSMRRARDLREANDRQAAEAKAKVLAGTTVQILARAGSTGRWAPPRSPMQPVSRRAWSSTATPSPSTSRSRRRGPTRFRSGCSPTSRP